MSSRLQNLIYRSMGISVLRYAAGFPIALGALLYSQRKKWYDEEKGKVRTKILSTILNGDLTVRNGFFKGLKYPEFAAYSSHSIPKLIGTYEEELRPILERLKDRDYSDIFDIGCAEGYYAVGLAMTYPRARIHAHDIDKDAVEFCRRMARLNGVASRMEFGGYCDDQRLSQFGFTGRGLILCDAEGYELQLFTRSVAENLRNCDVVIELHDFIDPRITPHLAQVFRDTHTGEFVDATPRHPGRYPILEGLDRADQEVALQERSQKQQWAFFQPKEGL